MRSASTSPPNSDPYAGLTQSPDLRVTSSLVDPHYTAKNDTYELNIDVNVTPELTLTSQTAYNQDHLYSTEDYNRFNTCTATCSRIRAATRWSGRIGEYCDPQLGCSSRLVGQDVSREHAHQFYQEVRLTSNFEGPLNFVAGGNYLNYKTLEDYIVMSNAISLATEHFNNIFGGGTAPARCNAHSVRCARSPMPADRNRRPTSCSRRASSVLAALISIPIRWQQIDGNGHNYFRSQNPYRLTSWALFGEAYYQVAPDVKLTGGIALHRRQEKFRPDPELDAGSWRRLSGQGNASIRNGRKSPAAFNINWTPKLDFTDQTMVYASYAHGYKGGGANPPGVVIVPSFAEGIPVTSPSNQTHPLTFKPEFNDAFELGTKNSLLDGAMTLNADIFLYKYQNYQISQIVDRTSVNLNFDATVKGAELESTWEPVPGLRFNLAARL